MRSRIALRPLFHIPEAAAEPIQLAALVSCRHHTGIMMASRGCLAPHPAGRDLHAPAEPPQAAACPLQHILAMPPQNSLSPICVPMACPCDMSLLNLRIIAYLES